MLERQACPDKQVQSVCPVVRVNLVKLENQEHVVRTVQKDNQEKQDKTVRLVRKESKDKQDQTVFPDLVAPLVRMDIKDSME